MAVTPHQCHHSPISLSPLHATLLFTPRASFSSRAICRRRARHAICPRPAQTPTVHHPSSRPPNEPSVATITGNAVAVCVQVFAGARHRQHRRSGDDIRVGGSGAGIRGRGGGMGRQAGRQCVSGRQQAGAHKAECKGMHRYHIRHAQGHASYHGVMQTPSNVAPYPRATRRMPR